MDKSRQISRRAWLKGCAYVTGIGALSILGGRFALADDAPKKAAKSAVQYQDYPKDGKMCVSCRFFNRPAGMGRGMTGGGMGSGMMGGPMGGMMSGTCQVVEGEVSPRGYCVLYTQA